jgi:RimK family alpha-L-glutamate ligase
MVSKFNEYVKEEIENKKPYRLAILSHDEPDDPNETGSLIRKSARSIGLDVILVEFQGSYLEENNGKLLINTFVIDEEGVVQYPDEKEKDVKYDKPFLLNPKDTLIMVRGLGSSSTSGSHSWTAIVKDLEYRGFFVVNTIETHDNCADKVYNQILFERNNFNTPKTVRIPHVNGVPFALKKIGNKFPMILKTGTGSRGVGVILVESEASLTSIVQLLYRENKYIDILLQEQIDTEYDVRAVVCLNQVMGVMKRPIIKGDFRSNVSQGSKPEIHELTKLEESEVIRAAKAIKGNLVGVDFIPSKDREKKPPYFIEVNASPGFLGIEEALKKDGSFTKKVLKSFMNRDYWK